MDKNLVIDCHSDGRERHALALAARLRGYRLRGVTACYDEAGRDRVDVLRGLLPAGCLTARGAHRPLILRGDQQPEDFPLPETPPPDGYAWDLLNRVAREDERGEGLTVVTMGALTNLALALFRDETLAARISSVILCAGSSVYGDVTPYAQSSVYQDAYACQAVLQAGVPVTMVGLNCCESLLRPEAMRRLFSLAGFADGEADAFARERLAGDGDLSALLGLVGVCSLLFPERMEREAFNVQVETSSALMYARTVTDWRYYHVDAKDTTLVTAVRLDP